MRSVDLPTGILYPLCWLFLLAVLFGTSAASALPATLFEEHQSEGMREYQAGRYAEAIVEFQVAYDICLRSQGACLRAKPTNLLYNIGQAYLKLRQPRQALRYFAQLRLREGALSAEMAIKLQESEQRARDLLAEIDRTSLPSPSAAAPPLPGALPPPDPPHQPAPPTQPIAITAAAAAPPSARPTVTAPPRAPTRWTPGRISAAATLGGLVVLSLATAVALTALDGKLGPPQCPDGIPGCTYNFAVAYGTSYGVAGLLAGGLVLALTLPTRTRTPAR